MVEDGAAARLVEDNAVMDGVREDEAAVAGEIDIADLDIRVVPREIVVPGERAADLAISPLVVDGVDDERVRALLVQHLEEAELADEPRREILQHEAFV